MNENEVIEESAEVADEIEETEDVSEDAEEDLAEEFEESEEDEELDEDFEYDEDGNIIIPDEDKEEDSSPTADAVPPPHEEESKEEAPKADPRDKEIADLRRKLSRLESLGKDAIKAVGLDEKDVELGLAGIAAETQGKSARDILDAKKQEEAAAEARAQIQSARFEQIAATDLAELHAAYPETRQYKHVRELPPDILKGFAKARDAGFTAKQAYAAANPDGIRTTATEAGKKAAMHNSKAHLTSNVPKMSKDTGAKLTRAELAEFREMFPDKSDAEIVKLYRQVNK
jgi:hypothetical protein